MAISCSIGIVFYPEGGVHAKLIARADAAMYAAKRSGGGCYCIYEPSMDVDAHDQLDLQRDLRTAWRRKSSNCSSNPRSTRAAAR